MLLVVVRWRVQIDDVERDLAWRAWTQHLVDFERNAANFSAAPVTAVEPRVFTNDQNNIY